MTTHDYTGLYADKEPQLGVARFSSGTNEDNFVSGLATKLFRDGEEAANAVYIHGPESFKADESKDPFSKPLLSAVHGPDQTALKVVNFGFSLSSNPNIRPVDQMATHHSDGTEAEEPRTPFMLEVESSWLSKGSSANSAEEVVDEQRDPQNAYMQRISDAIDPGTVIGEEWGRDSQTGERIHLATYVAVTDLISSKAGDEELHFRHSRGEESGFTKTVQGFVNAYDRVLDIFAPN